MRLFIGIDLSHELKQALLEFQTDLKGLGVGGAYKSPDNFHITLEFLGELDKSQVPVLINVLTKVAGQCEPFELTVGGLGVFPSFKRAHTLWTGIGGNLPELDRLKKDLHLELKNRDFKLEERQFKPHITLASRPTFDQCDLTVLRSKSLGHCRVREIVLFESKVTGGRRAYINLAGAGLEQSSSSG